MELEYNSMTDISSIGSSLIEIITGNLRTGGLPRLRRKSGLFNNPTSLHLNLIRLFPLIGEKLLLSSFVPLLDYNN